jgi:hypothetical protein
MPETAGLVHALLAILCKYREVVGSVRSPPSSSPPRGAARAACAPDRSSRAAWIAVTRAAELPRADVRRLARLRRLPGGPRGGRQRR